MLLPEERSVPVLGEHEGIAQFVARFPGAHSVQVVGSFNDWRTGTIPLEDRDGDGVWRAVVVLPAGAHEYMFVVDDERWVPDYSANRFVEDDFGRENSVLIDRKSTRLNSSHLVISYAVFCLKKKKNKNTRAVV